MIALLASFVIATNATPRELVESCRAMIPANIEIRGEINLRNRRGISLSRHAYELSRTNAVTHLAVDGKPLDPKPGELDQPILGTDVTWSDLSLEYLWWDDFEFDAEREAESVHGRTVRAWVDRKTGALMQAEELRDGQAVRRLWGTRLKKFGDRWMANVMEVETIGSGHRTKITVDDLK